MPRGPREAAKPFSWPDFPSRTRPWCLIEDIGDGDFNGNGRFCDPSLAQGGRHTNGFQFGHEFAVPLPAYISIRTGRRLDVPDLAFELAGNVVRRSGAGNRDLSVVTEVLDGRPHDRIGQKDRDRLTFGTDTDTPRTCAFRHERGITGADHDRDTCLKEIDD